MLYELNSNIHAYSFSTTGLNKDYTKRFLTRDDANQFMYKLMNKYNLKLIEIWNDKHDKTYCCSDNVKFYIQRV